jgi:hypothetical protein
MTDRSETSMWVWSICVNVTQRFQTRRDVAAAKNMVEGKTVSKYWISLHKQRTTRDLIRKLKLPPREHQDKNSYATRSDKMAEIARNHHHCLQEADTNIPQATRERVIQNTINAIDSKLTEEEKAALDRKLSEDGITTALASTSNGKAPGLDGIPYELWKILNKRN